MSQVIHICNSAIKESERIRTGTFTKQCADFNDVCFALKNLDRDEENDAGNAGAGDDEETSSSSSSSSAASSSSASKRNVAVVDDAEAMKRARQFAFVELKAKAFEASLKELKKRKRDHHNETSSSSSSSSSATFDPASELKQIMESKSIPDSADGLTDQQLKKSEAMREYRSRFVMNLDEESDSGEDSALDLNSDGELDDEELERTRNKVPKKCKLTMATMEDPMQFQECGHIFSKIGIMNLFKNKTTIKCPGGCQKTVRKSDLRPVQNQSQKRLKSRRQFNESFLGSQVDNYDWADN